MINLALAKSPDVFNTFGDEDFRRQNLPPGVTLDYFGGGGKTATSTSQVSIPPEVLARYNSVNDTAQQVAQTPFQSYSSDPNAFVAPLNQTQNAGIANTNAAANQSQPAYQAAEGLTLAGAGPANLGSLNTNQYLSPFLGDVYNQTLRGEAQQNAQQSNQLTGNAITSGAFGGDRAGIAQANLAYQQNLSNAQTNSGLLNTGYQQAQSVAQQQQGAQLSAQQANLQRLQSAGAQLGGLGGAAQSSALSGAQAQLAAGATQQQTQQAGLSALYNQFQQQQAYPFQTAQFLANIAEGTGALSGSTTTTTSPAPFFSDRRLKEGIRRIGETDDGLPIYKFRYKDDPKEQTHIGFMADEVEKKHPDAVGLDSGYKTVDYDKATRHEKAAGGGLGGFDPTLAASLLQAQQAGYAGLGGVPGKVSYVPQASAPVGHLSVAQPSSKSPQSGASQINDIAKAGQGLKSAYNDVKPMLSKLQGLGGASDTGGAPMALSGAVDSGIGGAAPALVDTGIGLDPSLLGAFARGGRAHYDNGGSTSDDPSDIGIYPVDGPKLGIPEENPNAKLVTADAPKNGSGSGSSGFGDAMKVVGDILPFFLASGGRVHKDSGGGLGGYDYAEPVSPNVDASDLDPTFADRVQDLQQDAGLAGVPSKMISGYRDVGKQAALYNKYQNGTGGLAAPPGKSYHNYGLAADVMADDPNQQQVLIDMARQPSRGLKPGADFGDNDHFQIAGSRPSSLPAVAYAPSNGPDASSAPASHAIRMAQNDNGTATDAAPASDADPGILGGLGQVAGGVGDWFGKNQNWLVPVLTGLGTMASSNSRYLGSAILQGLGGGAKEYGDYQKQQSEIAKNTLGLAAQRFTPVGGNMFYDRVVGDTVPVSVYQSRLSSMPGVGPYLSRMGGAGAQPAAAQGAGSPPTGLIPPSGPSPSAGGAPSAPVAPVHNIASAPLSPPDASAAPDSGPFGGLGGAAAAFGRRNPTSAPASASAPTVAPTQAAADPNIAKTQAIYAKIDADPNVAKFRDQANAQIQMADQYAAKANDPAMIATGKATEYLSMANNLRAQAQQSITQWQDLRKAYAAPAISALTGQSEALAKAAPDVAAAEAAKAGQVAQATQSVGTKQELAKKQLDEQNAAAKSAYAQQFRLEEMDRQFSSLPQTGLTAPGSFATERLNFAKNINSALAGFGAKPLFAPDDVASAETLGKDTKRLGFETSKAMGGREPGFIVQQAISANPGIDNTPMGYRRIVAGLKQAAQYEQDRSDFYNSYYTEHGDLVGAEKAFRTAKPVEGYGRAAVLSTIPPGALDYLKAHPDQAKLFDQKYGQGSSKMVMGQ